MGVIQVPGRLSGKTYSVKIKGDTPSETEQARIRAYLDEQESTFAAEYEASLGKPLVGPDDGTALGRGFERGKASAKSLLGTTVETIGQQVGLPSIAEYGRGMEEAAAQRQFELSLLQPAPTTRQDVAEAEGFFPTIGAGLTYAGELAGEQIPQLGVGLAGGAAGAVAGGVTAGPAGAIAGFGIGSGLVEAPMLFGANVQRQEEEVAAGRKAAVDLTDALGSTVGQSALTAVTNALAGAGIFVRPGAKLFTRAVSGATVGGTTESLNEVGQQMLERYQAGLPVDSPDAIQEYIDAGVAGGVLGFGAGGIGGAVGGPRPAEAPKATAPAAPAAAPTVTQPSATPGEIAAAAQEVTAEPTQAEAPAVSEEEVTERTLDARGIYDERVAIALDNGASDEEAAQTAARAALNYISELPQPVQDQLAPFKATMERRARASAGGVMQPDLPDTAYASEFGGTAQRGLFETAKPAAVEAPAAPPAVETEAEIFDRAEAQYAGARKPAPVTRTAAPVSEAQAPAMKPGPAVWANADFDLPVEVADAAPQAGPDGRFYQQVIDPSTKQPSFVPLDELRQAEPAPAKAQAAPTLQTWDTIKPGDKVTLYRGENQDNTQGGDWWTTNPEKAAQYGAVRSFTVDALDVGKVAVQGHGGTDEFFFPEGVPPRFLAPTQEAADVTTVAEVKPEEVGAGVPSGGQGVEGGGRPADDAAGTAGTETPAGGGLGGGVPLSVDTAAAAGEQPTSLSQLEEQLVAARAEAAALRKKVPAGVLKRELVGGAVDPALEKTVSNLQNVLTQRETAAETAKNAVPKKPTNPARPKKLKAYEDALAKVTDTRDQLAAAQDALSTAELAASLRRGAQPKVQATGKAAAAYTDYINALRRADVIRQQVDSVRAREERTKAELDRAAEAAAVPAAPPSLTRPRVPLYRMGPAIAPTPPLRKTSADAEVDKALSDRYATSTPLDIKIGAQLLNEAGMKLGVKDPLTVDDKRLVLTLLNPASRIVTEQGAAAKLYFSRVVRPIDAILMIVDDLTAPYGKYRTEPGTDRATRAFFAGTGRTAAKLALEFVRARMSPAVQNEVDFRISLSAQQNKNQKTWLSDVDRVERTRAERLRAKEARAEAAKESGYTSEEMSTDPLAALDRELHYSVKMALNAGNLKDALLALSETTNNADLSKLAARFAELTGTTRVKVLYPGDPAKNIGRARGIFWQARANEDPERQNIIYLNGQVGMNAHVLMHEMAHAVTANMRYLQPNHPVLKQLEALRKEIIKQSGRSADRDAFYGLTNLGEFIAEAYGRVALGENDNGLRDLMNRTSIYTEVGYQRELPLTATQRLKEIFGNFLRSLIGLPSKPYPRKTEYDTKTVKENAMDQFQRLADGILSEAPHVLPDNVFQRAVSEPMVARNVLNNAIQSGPKWDKAGRDKLSDQMQASIPMPLRRMLLGLLQLDWFNDLAGKYFPQIAALKELDDLRRGELVQMEQRAKGVLEDLLAYANKYPEMYTKLMAIMGRATLEEVDPTKPLSNYIMDDDKARVWDELNNELRTADSTGEMRKLFKTVRNMFAQFREDIKAVLSERVKEMTDDVATQNQLVARLLQKLDEEKAIDPYFTLMRKGDFWLTYVADDTTAPAVVDPNTGVSRRPPTQFVQAFNSVWERDQFRTKLEATKDAAGNPVAWDFEDKPRPVGYNPDERVPTAFAQGAINIISSLVSGKTDPEEKARGDAAIAEVMDMFSRFTPEHSILQSFNKRKGVRGFMGDITPLGVIDRPTDMVQALAEKSSSLAYQLANMKYGARIQKLKNQSDTTLKTLSNSPSLSAAEKQAVLAYHEEFKARATFAQSPRVSQPAQALRGVTFGMTLGFNIAGALNNLMQIPMIGTTELGGRYSMPGAIRELGSAARLLMNAGKTKKVRSFGPDGMELREMSSVDDFGSVANYFEVNDAGEYVLRTDKKIPSKLRNKLANLDVLVETLSANGMLTNSMAQEMLDAEAGWLHKINKWSGFMMHHAERFNRQAMAIAAYNLELGKIDGPVSREAKLAAANKAIEIAERVNGSIGASTAPRFAQGAVGSVVFMFKRFGLHMARYIIGTANQALRGASKEDRAIARYQIIGMLGTTALFAGVQGLPFFGELMAVFNLLFTDDDEEPAEVVIEKFLQEPFYHGALNYLTGAEIASRISMSGLIFRENKIEKDQSSLYDLFEMFGGPAVGVYMNTERGVELLSQGELYRGVEAMMPAFIKGAMKSVRFGTEGATTLRTDEVIPVSNLDIALQAIGYTPGAYARQQERVSGEKRIDEAVRSNKRKLLRKYNLALKEGDFTEVREVLKSMREFNQEYPEAAITSDTLTRSSNSFIQRSQEMISGVSFSPSGRARAQQSISEYDQDTSVWGSE